MVWGSASGRRDSGGVNAQVEAILAGEHEVTVTQFHGTEGMSQLFRFHLQFTSSERFDVSDLINQTAVVNIISQASNSDPLRTRYFHGVINRFSYLGETDAPGGSDGRVSRYRAEVVPWLWLLTQRTNCRIFQQQSVTDIIEFLLGEYTKSFNGDRLNGDYEDEEFRVQYRESDFAFLSRLMEEYGIFYFFRHSESACELVLADGLNGYFECEEAQVRYGEGNAGTSGDHIQHWEHNYEFRAGSWHHDDFDFESPTTNMLVDENSVLDIPGAADVSLYDYPGGYRTLADGRRVGLVRMQEQEATHELVDGSGISPCFAAGARFRLQNHPNPDETVPNFVLSHIEHQFRGRGESVRSGETTQYRNHFTCLPSTTIFRPPRVTPRPFVRGAQTAIVTGPEDEVIYTDQYGRVRIQFHWDREGESDEDSSCWVRVSQAWAGNGYGSVLLPHVGQEVIVSFLEGDPDRPLITGRVYNADNMPPETLPANKNRAIVAQDGEGNVIALDADEKRVDIQNAQDKFELTVGESVTATAGMDLEITLGCGVGINLGAAASAALAASVDVGLGINTSVFLGGAFDASFGASFSWAKGNFVNAGDSVGQIAFKKEAEFVSHEYVLLAGGVGSNNSVLKGDSESLTLSFGKTDPKFNGSPVKGLALGVFGSAVLGTVGIAAAGATAFLGAKAGEKGEFDGYAGGAVASGVGSLISSAISGALLFAYAKWWSQMSQSVHGGALPVCAQLVLSDTGSLLVGSEEVNIVSGLSGKQGTVKIVTGEFKAGAEKSTFSGDVEILGKLQSANLMDIGQPAAAAAAKAQAAADIARMTAQLAATQAQHAAKQAARSAAAGAS